MKTNTQLLYLEDLLKNEIIRPEEYLQRIEAAYRTNPTSVTEEEVDYVAKQFKRVDIPFERDLEASDANLLTTMNQFVSGLAEGFTTLGWADDPDTTTESIANKLGHLIGFAPDVIASFLSMGTYLPTAVAKRVTAKGAGAVAGGLQAAGKQAKKAGAGLFVNPKTFALQSIPMKVADSVMSQIKGSFGNTTVLTTGFMSQGLLANKKFRNIGEQGAHLGIALGFSAWKEGPKAMVESGLHGAAAGALFGTLGNYVNISKLISNPATQKEGLNIVKGVAKKVADTRKFEEGMQMLAKGSLGSAAQGGMATAQEAPLPEQVYEYMLGFFFGATAKSAGFLDRTRYINDLRLPSNPGTDYQARKQQLYKDEKFLALEKADQSYIERHLNILTTEQQGRKYTMDAILGKQFREVAQEQGFDLSNLTLEKVKIIQEQIQKEKSADVVDPIVPIKVKKTSVNDKESNKFPEKSLEEVDSLLGQVNLSIAELQSIVSNKDLNEIGIVQNNYLSAISKEIIRTNESLDLNTIKTSLDGMANNYLNSIRDGGVENVDVFLSAINKKYKIDPKSKLSDLKNKDKDLYNQLGSYLQQKMQVMSRPKAEIDLTVGDDAIFKLQPDVDLHGRSLGHAEGKNKYNFTFGEGVDIRFQISEAYLVEKIYKWKGGKKERSVFTRKKVLDWFKDPKQRGEFRAILNKELLFKVREQAALRDAYIYGGAKDSGSLILQKFPIQSKNKVALDYMSEGAQTELITRLRKDGYKYSTDIIDKEVVSNWVYLLKESGYINNTDKLTTSFIEGKIKEYQKDSLYQDVQKFNKYNNLAQGTNVRLLDENYESLTGKDGTWKFLAVEDLPSKFKIGNEASESGTDAVVYSRHKVFDGINTTQFRPEGNGFLKLVGYKAPEGGVGNILLKTGTFRATKAMNEFMEANNIDFIAYKTATKTQVGLNYHNLTYNNGKWGSSDPIQPFNIRPRELYLDYGVFENPKKIYQRPAFLKQMVDKINTNQLGSALAAGFKKDYNSLVDKSLLGDAATNVRFKEALDNNTEIKDAYRIDDVSIELLNENLLDFASPLGRDVIKKVLENGREIEELLWEAGESYDISEQVLISHEMADILRLNNYDPSMLMQKPFIDYVNKALHNYRTKRIIRPKVDYGFEAKLGPRDLETRTDNPITDKQFLLGEGMRKLPIKIEGYPETTLEKAWNELQSRNISSNRKTELENALEFIMARSPNSSNGGTRVLRFAGFSGRQGMEIVFSSKNDYMVGGADKDADSVVAFQGMSKNIKDTFNKYENELLESSGGVVVNKVISGMQEGADYAGLLAASNLGIPTGGSIPIGYLSNLSNAKNRAQQYGVKEFGQGYPPRTEKNIIDSNSTILFDGGGNGSRLTRNKAKKHNKPLLVLSAKNNYTKQDIDSIKNFLIKNPGVLNVAGSRDKQFRNSISKALEQSMLQVNMQGVKNISRRVIDIQQVRDTFKGLVKEYDVTDTKQKLTDLTDTDMRLKIATSARMGKVNIPQVVNAYTRMQNYAELIQQSNGAGMLPGNAVPINADRIVVNRTYQVPKSIEHTFRPRAKGEDYQRYEQDRKEDALRIDPKMNPSTKKVNGKFVTRFFVRPTKTEKVVLSLKDIGKDTIRELQLDHINIVNLMADSANYIEIAPADVINNAGMNKYFKMTTIDGKPIESSRNVKNGLVDYNGMNREIGMFKEINDMHKLSKGVFKVEDKQTYLDVANDYINNPILARSSIIYTKLAESYLKSPNFQIDPFAHYNKLLYGLAPGQKGGAEAYDIIKAATPILRENVVNWKYFKRFNMLDAYKDKYGIELKAELDNLMQEPGLMFNKYSEYMKLNIAMRQSEDFIQRYTERTGNEKNIATAESILEQVIDNTYMITSFYDAGRGQLRDMVGQKSYRDRKFDQYDMGLQDINLMIKRFKDKIKNKHPEDFTNIEMIIDSWLQAHPMKMFKTDQQQQAAADIDNASGEIHRRIRRLLADKRTLIDDPLLKVYFKQKAKAINQFQPKIGFISKSIAINPENKLKFYNTYTKVVETSLKEIQKKLKDPDKYNLEDYTFEDGEYPIDLDSFISKDSQASTKWIRDEQNNLTRKDSDQMPSNAIAAAAAEKAYQRRIKDTPKEEDIFDNTIEILSEKLLPFDWLSKIDGSKQPSWISYEMNAAMDKTIKILKKNPDATKYFEEYFIRASANLDMVGRTLETMDVKDLEIFNKYLEALPKFRELKKLPKPPDWIAQTLNYAVIGREMEAWDSTLERIPSFAVEGKDGKIKNFDITMPTSTLEMIRINMDRFDQLHKTQSGRLENALKLINRNMTIDDANTILHRNTLQEAVANTIEFNKGEFNGRPATAENAVERKAIEDSFNGSKKILDRLEASGVKFPMVKLSPGEALDAKKSAFKFVTPNEFVSKESANIAATFKSVHDNFISSRHKSLRKSLEVMKVKGIDEWVPLESVFKEWSPHNKSLQEMEKLFLDKNGLLREDRINEIFNLVLRKNISNSQIIDEILPGINDHRFFIHHRRIKDMAQAKLSSIDLNKPLNKKDTLIVKKLMNNLMVEMEYNRTMVGETTGYWARGGHTRIKSNVPKLEAWHKIQIEKELANMNRPEDFRDKASKIEAQLALKEITMAEAKKAYFDYKMGIASRTFGKDSTADQYDALQQTMDVLSNPNTQTYIGNYQQSNTESRGQEFMPFYLKSYDAIDNYLGGIYKGHFTNMAGFRAETLLKRFDYVNKGKDYQKNWSNYMRNAASSMMGMSSYRAFNLHGIEAKHQPLFKAYIENGFDKRKLAQQGSYEHDLLRDFDAAIEVSPRSQVQILKQSNNNIDVAKKTINKIKTKNAIQLSNEVNTTGKYGTLYHYLSDDVAVRAFSKLDKAFGGKVFGELPTGRKERQQQIIRRIKDISDLEGKFELLSLLSHPKTAITNMLGGTTNTISDTGWQPFRLAGNTDWMLSNIFANATYRYKDPITGIVEKNKKFTSRQDIDNWIESIGVYDQIFLDLVSKDTKFGQQNLGGVMREFITRVNRSKRDLEFKTEEAENDLRNRSMREVIRDSKVTKPIVDFGALPMSYTERKLRGRAFLANYINMWQRLGQTGKEIPFNSTVLVDHAVKGVQASQFMYQATFRPNFANTSLGRIMTRFQPYAWNSIGRRMKLYKDADMVGFQADLNASKKFQRQFTLDVMALALGNVFIASIFEYAMSPPMSWMQDSAALLFGDEKERDRAFFSSYPHPALAPLQIVTPPIGRFVLSPISAVLNGEWETFSKYQLATYFPFGRLYRDAARTYDSPSMAVEWMTGLPLHQVHNMRRNQIDKENEMQTLLDFQAGDTDLSESEYRDEPITKDTIIR